MVDALFQSLGSYDLFGKSVPGAALVLGVWSLLPTAYFPVFAVAGNSEAINIAILLIVVAFSGLMIGQWIHTLADDIERIFRWLLNIIEDIRQILVLYGINVEFDELRINIEDDPESSTVVDVSIDWYNGVVEWTRERFWGTFDSFSNHRFLFAKWIQWNYVPSNYWRDEETRFDDRWELESRNEFLGPFCSAFEATFGEDIREMEVRKVENYYPHITAHLDGEEPSTHRQFQAIYSFCRSMWVVLLILSIFYSLAIYQPFGNLSIIVSEARIQMLPRRIELIIPVVSFASSLLFLDASGTYKRHFIEYLLASFAKQYQRQKDDSDQKDISRY